MGVKADFDFDFDFDQTKIPLLTATRINFVIANRARACPQRWNVIDRRGTTMY